MGAQIGVAFLIGLIAGWLTMFLLICARKV
jgi:hypothetical protein